MTTYPWHKKAFSKLHLMTTKNRLPNTLLITGAHHVGKLILAKYFIASMLCENREKDLLKACGVCHACVSLSKDDLSAKSSEAQLRIRRSHHRNVIYCRRELNKNKKLSEVMQIDQVRTFCDALQKTSNGLKIGLLFYADEMNQNSADSLLKTLEEPPLNTLIILLAHRLHQLPATIISRCQIVYIAPSYDEETKAWLSAKIPKNKPNIDVVQLLKMSYGVPLAALSMLEENNYDNYQCWQKYLLILIQNPLDIVDKDNMPDDLQIALRCLRDLLICAIRGKLIRGKITEKFVGEEEVVALNTLIKNSRLRFLFALLGDVEHATYLSNKQTNFPLLFDNILAVWSHITKLASYPKITDTPYAITKVQESL